MQTAPDDPHTLALLRALYRHPGTTHELARTLKTHPNTIRRDILQARVQGYSIFARATPGGLTTFEFHPPVKP